MGLTKKEIAEWLRAAKADDEKVLEKARKLAWERIVEMPEEPLRYTVSWDGLHLYPKACTCPQNKYRGKICKHMVMAFILAHKKELARYSKKWAKWFNELDMAIEEAVEKRRKELAEFLAM